MARSLMCTRAYVAVGPVALLIFVSGSLGCAGGDEPAWAFDPVWVQPTDDGVRGLQSWHVFRKRWHERRKERHYVCSVIVEFEGEAGPTCPGCLEAWVVTPRLTDTDCEGGLEQDPAFLSLRALGLGEQADAPEAPHAGRTRVGYADYGFGWEVHGWAYPDGLDDGREAAPDWDGEQPYQFWPTSDWPLR